MYKWHVHSAIGRGRPLMGDFAKVTDGIAASLRQFHVSVMRSAEDGGEVKISKPSRAQRSAAAAAEISSLSPGGIDARSLAARPPASFTVRRIEHVGPAAIRRPGGATRGAFRSRASGMRGGPGGSKGRGGLSRGVRGVRGAAGRGRGRARQKRGGGQQRQDEFNKPAPFTPEEQAYIDSIEMGLATPARVGITDLESLKREATGMPMLSTTIGVVSSIREHYRAITGEKGNDYISTEEHARHYRERGATLFVDEEDRARAIGPNRFAGSPETYDILDDADRESILQTLGAGQYQSVKPATQGDVLANVDVYGLKNRTYLPEDTAAVRERIQSMLPKVPAAKRAAQTAVET